MPRKRLKPIMPLQGLRLRVKGGATMGIRKKIHTIRTFLIPYLKACGLKGLGIAFLVKDYLLYYKEESYNEPRV